MAKAEDPKLASVIYNMLESIRIIALYMEPFMLVSSLAVYEALGLGNIEELTNIQEASVWGQLKAGSEVKVIDALFPRLKEDEIDFSIE